ncbi:MAG: TRAP transporter substrate-binding protein, partial [Geminicoccaceae bacterium]|nr:TRAP transporter substrate-binding protein [Geminicoccaceae bacterium]
CGDGALASTGETTMQRRHALSLGGFGLAGSALPMPAIAQERTRWRMVTTWPKDAPGVGTSAQRLADRIGQMSGGRLEVELFAAGELVPAFEALDAVQRGVAEMSHSASFFWLGKSPALNYFGSIPFGLTKTEIEGWLYMGGGAALWRDAMAPFDVLPFYAGSSATSAGGWFRKEIKAVDDLDGLKIRMAGLGGEVMRRLGATPVLTPPSEVFQAMSTGTVDAAELIGPWADQAFGLDRIADYYYVPGFHEVGPTAEVLISRAAFEELPADLQALVEAAIMAEAMAYGAEYRFHNVLALTGLVRERGVELRVYPEEVIEALGRTALEVLEELGATNELTRTIHASYMAFLEQAIPYSDWFDRRILAQRSTGLAPLVAGWPGKT